MLDQPYDMIVIGGCPGGQVAAIRCAQLGLMVDIVEREHMDGVCLNVIRMNRLNIPLSNQLDRSHTEKSGSQSC
ncbi:MAG: hypothetical protein ACR2PF_11390 [Rhizobiaceae bacterium]